MQENNLEARSVLSTLFRSRIEKHSNYYHVSRSRPSPLSSAGPAPITPPPAPTQDFTDEDVDAKKSQQIYDEPVKITIPKEVSQWCKHTVIACPHHKVAHQNWDT